MTGYGLATLANEKVEITVEIKSLNSKFLDTSIKLPKSYSNKEIDIRNTITDKLQRGKINLSIDVIDLSDNTPKVDYNKELFLSYYEKLNGLAALVKDNQQDIFKLAIQSPEVIVPQVAEGVNETQWNEIFRVINEAIDFCDEFRKKEGHLLAEKLMQYINRIASGLEEVDHMDPSRVEKIKTRIKTNLEEFIEEENIDKNRFEQEMIYFIEKLDISEEKVRLKSHLDYFKEALADGNSNGKKLGFIAQEIGREINTIGSKANDATIQKTVVVMKEELEKIKEQVLNVV